MMRSTASNSQRRWRSLRQQLGYTVVEVMMALAILSIGTTGVIAMQKTALIGNTRARNLATANALAASWIERLRVDGLRWRDIPGTNLDTLTTDTAWLKIVNNDFPTITGNEGRWLAPDLSDPQVLPGYEQGADVRGVDETVIANQAFCPEIRLTQILPTVIRAEVRVYWLRNQGGGQINAGGDMCPVNNGGHSDLLNEDIARNNYHFVYLSTTIRKVPPE